MSNASLEARPACCCASSPDSAAATPVAPSAPAQVSPQQPAIVTLTVPGVTCGACVRAIETGLASWPGVASARVNLDLRRLTIAYHPTLTNADALTARVRDLGFEAAELADDDTGQQASRVADYIPRLGVAGFAAANIMLLSVSVWSGEVSDMDPATRSMFHWVSALIALPAVAYSGQPFFRSAAAALSARRLNMDVPISLGIILATAMSLYQTIRGTGHVYFDAAITLVFFLLIGRTLDERMRARATGAAHDLLALRATGATVIDPDGTARRVKAKELQPGQKLLVAAGERIAADGIVTVGRGEVDDSLLTGESVPRPVGPGDRVHAGTVNGGAPLTIDTVATAEGTLLAEIGRLMLAAEQGRGRYVRLADRAARIYAPAVHVLGLLTFAGWAYAGSGVETALTHAVAVLIITCPCALALAVPAVQVAAVSRLFRAGVILKAADGLERLSEIDTVVLDKTGTLTTGELRIASGQTIAPDILAAAASLAIASRHPYARGIVRAAADRGFAVTPLTGVREEPGSGIAATTLAGEVRLGSAAWCGVSPERGHEAAIWYTAPGTAGPGNAPQEVQGFRFEDTLRTDAASTAAALRSAGFAVEILSGDRPEAVAAAAQEAGIPIQRGGVRPDQKLAHLATLSADGRRVLMVGDGLNDAPALAAAHASLSPASAVDVSQIAADGIIQGERLGVIVDVLAVARQAHRMALQNFALALAYNVVFVPLAMAGLVTPLIAALAMSGSSIMVTANALRLRNMKLTLAPQRAPCRSTGDTPSSALSPALPSQPIGAAP